MTTMTITYDAPVKCPECKKVENPLRMPVGSITVIICANCGKELTGRPAQIEMKIDMEMDNE